MPVFVSARVQGAKCPGIGASLRPSLPTLRTADLHLDVRGASGIGFRLSVSSRLRAIGLTPSWFQGTNGNA